MNTINISTENNETYSSISNIFIDHYMADANGDFVKVYIYLVRLFHSNSSFHISDIADHFNCTENDVTRAIKYWVKNDVLSFTYDSSENISGIILKDLRNSPAIRNKAKKEVDITAVFNLSDTKKAKNEDVEDTSETEVRTPVVPAKGRVSSEIVNAKNYDENFQEILSQAEAYFDRPLTQSDINSFIYIQDKLGFNFELMEYLLEYCATLKKTTGSAIEKTAIEWFKRGYKTREQAAEDIAQFRDLYKNIMKNLGIGGRVSPTPSELKYINKWVYDDLFSDDIIIEACKKANIAKPNSANFPYVNGIIEKWKTAGVHVVSDIAALETKRHTEMPKASGKSSAEDDDFNRIARHFMGETD
ncbi:MAG: DnaD domain protein [Eubacterium sp.]|nr:DnaD domain protein [Eubacterium sp.]